MNRLGIYSFYDPDGVIGTGDILYLSEVARVLNDLVIVVNGHLKEEARQQLSQYATRVIFRENRGFDGGAFREVLLKRLPEKFWKGIDELVLFNNTVFGPAFPLMPIFDRYSDQPVDFWGMTRGDGDDYSWPKHLQSYFLVFKKSVLQSSAFWPFWQNLHMNFTDMNYLIATYEVVLASYLEKHGFQGGFLSEEEPFAFPLRTLRDGVPVLKKKIFRTHGYQVGTTAYEELFQKLRILNPKLLASINSYMERYHFDWKNDGDGRNSEELHHGENEWKNEEILAIVQPYQHVYFFGCTIRSYYLMSKIRDKDRFLVESDQYAHSPYQGDLPILHISELPAYVGDDSVIVVFLKRCEDSFRERLGRVFSHIVYLSDGRKPKNA